jgi:hypothetical protein
VSVWTVDGPKNALTFGACRFVNYLSKQKYNAEKTSRRVSQRAEEVFDPREI